VNEKNEKHLFMNRFGTNDAIKQCFNKTQILGNQKIVSVAVIAAISCGLDDAEFANNIVRRDEGKQQLQNIALFVHQQISARSMLSEVDKNIGDKLKRIGTLVTGKFDEPID
jgi:hypothetical protein